MPKSARLASIKSLRCYTIMEAAEVTGVSTRTVRTWIKQGLSVLADERPTLIRGDDLIKFIRKKRAERKTHVPLHEFYCLKCRQSRGAAEGFATFRFNGTRVNLKAFCEVCESVINKTVVKSRLSELRRVLEMMPEDQVGGPSV